MARANALAVPSVVAIKNGGLLSSANGVFDMMPNSRAGSDTYSRKKFIQARPVSGSFLNLPQAKPMKINPKYGSARLRMSTMVGAVFSSVFASNQALGKSAAGGLIRRFGSSIGHNHGLFDELWQKRGPPSFRSDRSFATGFFHSGA